MWEYYFYLLSGDGGVVNISENEYLADVGQSLPSLLSLIYSAF